MQRQDHTSVAQALCTTTGYIHTCELQWLLPNHCLYKKWMGDEIAFLQLPLPILGYLPAGSFLMKYMKKNFILHQSEHQVISD